MNVYREQERVGRRPGRWRATFLVRIVTWLARRRRASARAYIAARRRNVLACWSQIQSDAGFLYPISCVCGHHSPRSVPSRVKGQMAESWPYVNPRDVERQ